MPDGIPKRYPYPMIAFEGYREMTVEEILYDPKIEAVNIGAEEIYLTKYAGLAEEIWRQ